MNPRSRQAGLSTIEVLVAVAVMGIALTPLVAVQAQIAQTHARYQAAYSNATLQKNALGLLQDMNPMKTPTGELDLDGVHHLRWTSQALTRVDRSTDYPVGDGFYDVALYSVAAEVVDAQAADAKTAVKLRFNTERLGWQRIEGVDPTTAFGARPDPNALPRPR